MSRVLIVDGHNAIFAIESLATHHQVNREQTREALVSWLQQYQDSTDTQIIVVFDGQGKTTTKQGGTKNQVLVIYSSQGITADAHIEQLAAKYAEYYQIMVATQDMAIIHAVSESGATVISIKKLADLIDSNQAELKKKWLK